MQLFSSDDPAIRLGEAIGSIIAATIYVGLFGIIFFSLFHH
jgi:hypothetical protein